MAVQDRRIEASQSNRTLIIGVAVAAAIIIAALFYVLMRASGGNAAEPTLQGGLACGLATV